MNRGGVRVYVYVCVCVRARVHVDVSAKGDDVDIAGFDVSGNTGSTAWWNAHGFLARIGRDFATNRSHRAVDFFRSP